MPLADVGGAQLSYQVIGDGTPLVLLLPQSSGPAGRQAFVDELAQRHTVVSYDQRGTGASSASPGSMSMADQGADVVGLLDALGFEQVALVCHSTGCGIGLSLAASDPRRVRSLVLATPWTYADKHLSTMQNLRIAAARALDPQQYARFNAALLFSPEFRRANQAGFDQLAAQALANPHDAEQIAARLQAILAFDSRPLLPTIGCPTLVAASSDDQLMPAWFARQAAQAIAGARYQEFDGGGHMLPETRTPELVAAIEEFLAR